MLDDSLGAARASAVDMLPATPANAIQRDHKQHPVVIYCFECVAKACVGKNVILFSYADNFAGAGCAISNG